MSATAPRRVALMPMPPDEHQIESSSFHTKNGLDNSFQDIFMADHMELISHLRSLRAHEFITSWQQREFVLAAYFGHLRILFTKYTQVQDIALPHLEMQMHLAFVKAICYARLLVEQNHLFAWQWLCQLARWYNFDLALGIRAALLFSSYPEYDEQGQLTSDERTQLMSIAPLYGMVFDHSSQQWMTQSEYSLVHTPVLPVPPPHKTADVPTSQDDDLVPDFFVEDGSPPLLRAIDMLEGETAYKLPAVHPEAFLN